MKKQLASKFVLKYQSIWRQVKKGTSQLKKLLMCRPIVTLSCGTCELKLQNLTLPEGSNISNFVIKMIYFSSQNSCLFSNTGLITAVDELSPLLLTQKFSTQARPSKSALQRLKGQVQCEVGFQTSAFCRGPLEGSQFLTETHHKAF